MKKLFYYFSLILVLYFQTLAQDTVRVKLTVLYPPYSDMNGNLGLNKMLLNKIIPPSIYKIRIIESDTANLADLIGLCEKYTLHNPKYNFSSTLFESNYLIISSINKKIDKIEEIADNKIGVVENSLAEKKMEGQLFFYTKYNNYRNAFFGLLNNDVEYLIVEKASAIYFLQQELIKDKFFIVNDDLFSTAIGFYINSKKTGFINQVNESIAGFKKTSDYKNLVNKYYTLPRDYSVIWIIIIAVVVIAAITLIILFIRKQNIAEKIQQYYKLNLKGLIIFRVSPTYAVGADNNDGGKFKDTMNDLQLKFNSLSFNYDYSGNSVKINIKTPKKIFLSDKEYLNNFTESLNNALKELPKNKYIIDINISGEFSDLKSHNSFLIVNKGNEIGLHIDKSKKTILPNL